MRAALQFLMRHMVKRAVMRSPIKRALGLADLERAQAVIYKLVVNGLLEEPCGGKVKTGQEIMFFFLMLRKVSQYTCVVSSIVDTTL